VRIPFVKYQGAGNDFVIFDAWKEAVELSGATIAMLCDRHFGIGADGLMLIRKMNGFDFEMVYYNSDGKTGSMCGNGGRCLVDFAVVSGLVKGPDIRFLASDGPHEAVVLGPGSIRLRMIDVDEIALVDDGYLINTGSPHFIRCVDELHGIDVTAEGRKTRFSERFKDEGVNVNFMAWKDGLLHVRTYERGVEAETLSCGTGVTASALLAHRLGITDGRTTCGVSTQGGLLNVSFDLVGDGFRNVWLEGPATFVFKGEIEL